VRLGIPMRLGIVSPYPPRRCGLAAYAGELVRALSPEFDVFVCAVDRHGLVYPDEAVAIIGQDDIDDYSRAARILAEYGVDAVLIQHDDGVFGGPAGSHVLELGRELRLRGIPYLVALHSVRRTLDPTSVRPVAALNGGAARVLVFTEAARDVAVSRRLAPAGSLAVVPMGVPEVVGGARDRPAPPVRPIVADALAAMAGRRVLSTVGLVRPGQGLELAISALAKIIAERPDVLYVVSGGADPDGASGGETYRDGLRDLVAELDLVQTVRFVDVFLTPGELAAVLGNTDVYLAPNVLLDRTHSGSLTHAVAAGCATVAARQAYTTDLLESGAGVVVPGEEADALADAVGSLLDDPPRLSAIRRSAKALGQRFRWPVVAPLIAEHVRDAAERQRRQYRLGGFAVPALRLDSLDEPDGAAQDSEKQDSDGPDGDGPDGDGPDGDVPVGQGEVPARLAVVSVGLLALPPGALSSAVRTAAAGRIASSIRLLTGADGEGEVPGWVVWGLGTVAGGAAVPDLIRAQARHRRDLVAPAMPAISADLGTTAYALLGLCRDCDLGPTARHSLTLAADRLDRAWLASAPRNSTWPWFAERLGGEGARLPQALIAAGRRLGDAEMLSHGVQSLDWYARRAGLTIADGVPRAPETAAAHRLTADRSGVERSIDAAALVEALVEAYRATGAAHYGRLARRAFDWFLGANRYAEPVYNPDLGMCRHGLGRAAVAERYTVVATLAYLGALLSLASADLVAIPVSESSRRDLAAVA